MDKRYKARLVIRGHRDRRKLYMIHASQTVQPSSTLILLKKSEIHDFELWLEDVKQVYIQTEGRLDRKIYISDALPEFVLKDDEYLQLVKPLYGLSESGDL